jgi:hypothetical protein
MPLLLLRDAIYAIDLPHYIAYIAIIIIMPLRLRFIDAMLMLRAILMAMPLFHIIFITTCHITDAIISPFTLICHYAITPLCH